MPRDQTYGEIAYTTHCQELGLSRIIPWDALSREEISHWENTAASVIAQYHKRQTQLSRQTQKQSATHQPLMTEEELRHYQPHPGPLGSKGESS